MATVDYALPWEYRDLDMRSVSTSTFRLVLGLAALQTLALLLAGCPDKKPKYPSCGSDKDCREGEHCVNRQCRQCAKDEHCDAWKRCVEGACVLRAGRCDTDDDCDGKVCKQHKCVACQDDNECGPDKQCKNGTCMKRGSCTVDEDCADEEDCVDGVCRREGRERPPDANCELKTIYFGFDQSAIDEASRDALGQTAECLQAVQGRGVLVSGYTDPRGTEEYNIALSERRAQSTTDYLSRLGIDPARFRVVPRGETEAEGTDESSYAKDRRVEFEWQ